LNSFNSSLKSELILLRFINAVCAQHHSPSFGKNRLGPQPLPEGNIKTAIEVSQPPTILHDEIADCILLRLSL